MRRQDFNYELPEQLIARQPTPARTGSRLMVLNGVSGAVEHRQFDAVLDLVEPGDLMVFNDTRVIPARLYGQKLTGGRIEILVERIVDRFRVLAQVRSSKSPRAGSSLLLDNKLEIEVEGREGILFQLRFPPSAPVLDTLDKIGQVPLPPYIDRPPQAEDRERYQTIYSQHPGAVAAPTAGLHFDDNLMKKLTHKGVGQAFVTLHVGAGTFLPMRVDSIVEHQMHAEVMDVSAKVCSQIEATQQAGKRVIAVGTTTVRCLETAASDGRIQPYQGETNIFIYPSYEYRIVDALITNFHLPESTLLMLVSAFAGYQNTMRAYRAAVEQKYRFFSYGDAMFITRNNQAVTDIPN